MTDKIYICFDYGDKRTGVALSDASALIATGRSSFNASGPKAAAREAMRLIKEILPQGIVVGYPLAPDGGSAGERCKIVDRFIAELGKRTDVPLYRQDERESSAQARAVIHAHGKSVTRKRRRAGAVDQIAAAVILQRWLDSPANKPTE
ncbi:Holliday junction resolvase RuvX [Gemmatimonas aurantiaca]|nr:Holliday junction resolvase RuvX [Gemmatimonas aurantiaca]